MRRTVWLARHGRTDYNNSRRFQGHLPVALDGLGREQAQRLATKAAALGPKALWSSPLRRARETAEIVAQQVGLPIREDPRLAETDAGEWTDLDFAEVRDRWPEQFNRFLALDPTFAFPGGESFAQQTERVVEALQEIAAGPSPALVICHGVVIRLAMRAFGVEPPQRIENGELVALEVPIGCGEATPLRSTNAAGSPQTAG